MFDLFEDGSGIDDDFQIPHVSADSGSSSEEEPLDENIRARSRSDELDTPEPISRPDELGWIEVDLKQDRQRIYPNFIVRNSHSAQNINYDETKPPLDYFSLFFFLIMVLWTLSFKKQTGMQISSTKRALLCGWKVTLPADTINGLMQQLNFQT